MTWSRPEAGAFLVAQRGLLDPNFAETVVLLLQHGTDGTMGVVINRRSEVAVGHVLSAFDEFDDRPDRLYLGGPVNPDRVTVLASSSEPLPDAETVIPNVHLVTSENGVREILRRALPESSVRVYAGIAGWAPGQLDAEIARGGWHLLPGQRRWVFGDDPDRTWQELIRVVFQPLA